MNLHFSQKLTFNLNLVFSVTCNSILCRLLEQRLSLSGYYWIGLSDSASEGTWVWLNGNRANPNDGSLWRPGYPQTGSSGNDRDCAGARFGQRNFHGLFVWDTPCSWAFLALCEKPV